MKINIHAGHNPDGKIACGAVGLIKESTEARKVKNAVISMLREMGHTVYDCTVDNGTSVNNVLKKIVAKCNAHDVDLDVSIHFNSGRDDEEGDGKTGGTEVWVYTKNSTQKERAARICEEIANLGFQNRGVKISTTLYVLKYTNAPALLIECCFVDDADDAKLYNYKTMAKAIVQGITGEKYVEKKTSTATSSSTNTSAVKIETAQKKSSSLSGKYKVSTNGARLALRAGAGSNKTFIKYLSNGSEVMCYGYYNTDDNGAKWLYVQVCDTDEVGYMHSSYLKKV